jgi:hypothetical protein
MLMILNDFMLGSEHGALEKYLKGFVSRIKTIQSKVFQVAM